MDCYMMNLGSSFVLTFIVSTLLFLWWSSSSPSLLLSFLILIMIILSGVYAYTLPYSKLNIMILTLVMGGGLFVLISFTIMSQPNDQSSIQVYLNWKKSIFLIFFTMIWNFTSSHLSSCSLHTHLFLVDLPSLKEGGEMVALSGSSSWSLILLLLLLLMSLKIVDSMTISKGSMFMNS